MSILANMIFVMETKLSLITMMTTTTAMMVIAGTTTAGLN